MSYTSEEYEQVKELLLEHRGKGNEISAREIDGVVDLDNVGSFPNTRACIRDIIMRDGIPVIGGGNGYYVAETEQEIHAAIATLDSRIIKTTERKVGLRQAARDWDGEIESDEDLDIL